MPDACASLEPATAPDTTTPAGPRVRRVAPMAGWRLRRLTTYVEAHLGERVTLAAMAAAAGLSRMHFAAQFRAAFGQRPHEYLLHRRVLRAQTLLATTEHTLVQVALEVGFQTQAHFTTVFARFAGTTPHRWRKASRIRPLPIPAQDSTARAIAA